jgi:hypothetical protein
MVIFGGIALVVIAGGYPLGKRVSAQYQMAENRVRSATNQLQEVRLWRMEIEHDRSGEDTLNAWIDQRGRNFQLYSFVSDKLRRAHLEDRYNVRNVSLGDSLQGVDLTVNGIELKELVELLHGIYQGKNLIVVQDLVITVGRNGGLDCRMTLIAPK